MGKLTLQKKMYLGFFSLMALTVAAVSLPDDTDGSPELVNIAPAAALHYLEQGMQRMLRSKQEFDDLVAAHPINP